MNLKFIKKQSIKKEPFKLLFVICLDKQDIVLILVSQLYNLKANLLVVQFHKAKAISMLFLILYKKVENQNLHFQVCF